VAQSQSSDKPLTYAGSSGIGSAVHIGMERFVKLSGAKLRHVAYKGSAPAILALMGGEINMAATSAMSATAAINTGKVRAIANLGPKRVPALPDLPTLAEQGYTGVVLDNAYNLWVPAKTPRAVVNALNQAMIEGLKKPENAKQLMARGSEPGEPLTPEQLLKEAKEDYAEITKAVQELGIKF
jgi:tripartite-type tricarboxylate transporter receptor subunit TctC